MTKETNRLLKAAKAAANHFGVLQELGVNLGRVDEGDEIQVLDDLDTAIENYESVTKSKRAKWRVRSLEI